MKLVIVFLAACLFLMTPKARAGFYIDPAIGMHFTDAEIDTTDDLSGTGWGIKIGADTLGFSYGLDYQTVTLESDNTANFELETKEMGLFVGYAFPLMLRVWATYMISLEADAKTGTGYDGGSGMKFGVGYTGLPFISLNAEFKKFNFDEDSNGNDTDKDYNATFFSVSIPLSL